MTAFTLLIEKLSDTRGKGEVKLLTFDGELDETNIEEHSPKIYKLIEDSPGRLTLIFRLMNLKYMNSKAIGYLTDWSNKIRAKGGRIFITDVPPNIKDLLKTIGLNNLFKEFNTLDDAKKDLY
jgi:anti-anti-sigma factor